MKQIYADLWQSPQETRFGMLKTHAFLLEHKTGRDLIYVAENPETNEAINKMGGVEHIYLSHNHEISEDLFVARVALSARLAGHGRMQPRFPEGQGLDDPMDIGGSTILPSGLEVIYTPGHTDNNLCYRYASPHGRSYLFTGDTLYLDNGEWSTLVMRGDGGNPSDLRASLAILRKVEVDVVITSVAVGEYRVVELEQSEWTSVVDGLITDLG